ncbi:hypothetical protein H5410_026061 [Solanum commersonii]|uniref:Uncharacterized protein n=1 Tax=Solanum commersonii TaxID=4109 RepID=A0A9J5YVH5_SOLCO|nr:hypothetical protein H5410_026061 [Solanum commersonii]
MEASRIPSNPSYERLPTSFYTSTPAETINANWADPNNSSEFEHLSSSQKLDPTFVGTMGVIWVIFDENHVDVTNERILSSNRRTTLVNASASPAKLETDLYVPRALASDRKLHEWEMFKVRFDIYYRGGVGRNGFNLGGLKYDCDVNMTFVDETTLVGGPSNCIGSVEDSFGFGGLLGSHNLKSLFLSFTGKSKKKKTEVFSFIVDLGEVL